MMIPASITFSSQGLNCCGDLYQPKDNANGYTIVMAHGFSGERCFRLPAFAKAFCHQGFRVVLFDYRGFGDSEGQPRQLINPWMQLDDWRRAIAYAAQCHGGNCSKIILWGSSFSGGHVVTLAAEDLGVAAIIAQVPFVSGRATLLSTPLLTKLKLTTAGIADSCKRLAGLAPYTLPVVSENNSLCMLDNSYRGYIKLRPEDNTTWQNAVPAVIALKLPFYNPIDVAAKIECPSLIIAAKHDELIPEALVQQMANKIPGVQYHILASDHFEPYYKPIFDLNIELQLGFLKQLL